MEKKKLKLDEIKVESFITSLEGLRYEGGSDVYPSQAAGVNCTGGYEGDPPNFDNCTTSPYPCHSNGGGGGSADTCANTCIGTCNQLTCAHTCAATCNYTNYGSCTCPPATAQYTGCYC